MNFIERTKERKDRAQGLEARLGKRHTRETHSAAT
jgi:hypothetical protein